MKIVLTLSLVIISAASFLNTLTWAQNFQESRLLFNEWTLNNNKSYSSSLEYYYRLYVFHSNRAKIDAHNRSSSSFKMSVNNFADLTSEEFMAKYTSPDILYNAAFLDSSKYQTEKSYATDDLYKNVKLDNEVNWEQKGALNPIRDQSYCGSCYAFSAIAAIEAADFIFNQPQVLKKFSEQYIINCGPEEVGLRLFGCDGGIIEDVYKFGMRKGVFSRDAFPYKVKEERCDTNAVPLFKLQGYKMISSNTMQELLSEIMISPVALSIEVTPSYQFYHQGIIDIKAPCGLKINHGVLAVGYKLDTETPYLIIRNSYGQLWGEAGYFRHAIGKLDTPGSCGVANSYDGRPIIK